MKLYDLTLSGNCHKVRLFLSLIGQPVELVPVNLLAGEHKQPAFREINPRGQIPVLEDGDFRLVDSQAILVYLAKRYANEWYPQDAETQGHIANWLADGRRFFFRGDRLERDAGDAAEDVIALQDANTQASLGFYPRWVEGAGQ